MLKFLFVYIVFFLISILSSHERKEDKSLSINPPPTHLFEYGVPPLDLI